MERLAGNLYKPQVANTREGVTPIYGLYRYVPRDGVWFLRFSVFK